MKISDTNFFYKNYVGHIPDDSIKIDRTKNMIAHYIDSGLSYMLRNIYEADAADEELNPHNVPRQLWSKDNLIDPTKFYLHEELYLTNPMPVFDPEKMSTTTTPYFHETKEIYTIDDLLAYIDNNIRRTKSIQDVNKDKGSILYLFNKYKALENEGIHPIDMVLFLVDYHMGEYLDIINLSRDEEIVLRQIREFNERLIKIDKHKIQWRGSLNDA